MAILAALFAPDHPYHWMTIGSAEDIRAMQLEDVQAFFRTLLPPGQRLARPRGRHRCRPGVRAGGAVLRRARRRRPPERRAAAGALDARTAAGARGSRRAAAGLHGVAFPGDVRRRRRRDGSRGRSARERQDLEAVSDARLRAAHRRGRVGVIRARASSAASACWRPPRRPGSRWPRLRR